VSDNNDNNLKFVRIGGPGLSKAAYKLPKSPLGRQAPLPTASVRLVERGFKPSVAIPETGTGMPFIVSISRPRD
jgi:hypothetical protein